MSYLINSYEIAAGGKLADDLYELSFWNRPFVAEACFIGPFRGVSVLIKLSDGMVTHSVLLNRCVLLSAVRL